VDKTPLVTLTTDFGTADGYVGAMKGVVLGIVPNVRLVDISHQIAPQDVRQAAFALYTATPFFPPDAIHLVVVDPGVGGARRAIAVRTSGGTLVGPDNGVFSYVMARDSVEAAVALTDPRYHLPRVSHTFHGRDVFAPAAAHLAAGVPIDALGPPVHDPITFPPPLLEVRPGEIAGEVLHVDRFGNVVTSIGCLAWRGDALRLDPAFWQTGDAAGAVCFRAEGTTVAVAGRKIGGVCRTYAEVKPGETLALVGSGGHLEIAVREGSAARRLDVRPGAPVALRW